jgi:hypothetical protein
MNIEAAQLETLNRNAEEAFWKRLLLKVAQHFPDVAPDDFSNRFQRLRRACEDHAIVTERGRFGFVCLGYILGDSFLSDKAFMETFSHPGLPPDDAVDELYNRVEKQLISPNS